MGSKSKKKVHKKWKKDTEGIIESDDTFAFIIGYTSGGAPYGVTWEEMGIEEEELTDEELPFS